MAFVKKSFADIYTHLEQDARQRTPQLSDFQEGSVVRTLFESFAVELTTLYEQLDLVYQAGFIDTAEEANLDRVVAVLGIKRNEPDFAAGRVLFTRDPGSNDALTIPIGTLVTTVEDESLQPAKKAYITIEEGHLPVGQNEVEVKVQAEVRGRQMIADAETVVVMPRPVPGVKHVNNARSIRFLGRDRETDEELRQRAKQVLLASGRASSTSIETALLSMPGVRAVCIKEDRTRPGMIQIFIDGLTEQNYASLQQRVDQVRAAGIYVMLEPAHLINLTLTIRISVDRRVKGEERSALEQRVTDAVESFIQRIPMGQPLLFSQLTAEILSSKGVVDLDDFRLRAEQLTDPANPQITQYGISARRIEASIYERFVPVSVRVASETKPLAVDVQVRVAFPSQPLQSWLATHHQDRLKECSTEPALLSYSGLLAVANGDPAASESMPIIEELQRFYSNLQTVATTIDWQIGLNELTQAALVEIVRSYFATVQEENPSGGGQISSRKILAHLHQLGAAGKLDKAWREYARRFCRHACNDLTRSPWRPSPIRQWQTASMPRSLPTIKAPCRQPRTRSRQHSPRQSNSSAARMNS